MFESDLSELGVSVVKSSQAAFDAWCEGVPGLSRAPNGAWFAGGQTSISFPLDSHVSLEEIESQSYWFKHRNRVIIEAVKRYPPSGPILDIGGGNGFVSLGLSEAGFPSFVVEPGPDAVSNCLTRGVPVIQAAFQDIDLPSDSLDAVALFDVLEHIEDDAGTLRRLHHLLKPGGMLYLTVPAYEWLWSQEDVGAGHFRRYTMSSLVSKLMENGFRAEIGTYMFAPLVAPIFLLRALPSLFRLRPSVNHQQSAREHQLPDSLLGKAVDAILQRELATIRQGKKVRLGSSCLIAARVQKG